MSTETIINKFLFLAGMLLPMNALGQHTLADSIDILALQNRDTIQIALQTTHPKVQMSFLMQGIVINIKNSNNNTSIIYPNAGIVKHQVKRHPNEVKAMHHQEGNEVRPDLFPLVTALNEVPAKIIMGDSVIGQCKHDIKLEKKKGNICFSLFIPTSYVPFPKDSLLLDITSSMNEGSYETEFKGQRLSRENRMPPNGLGNVPVEKNIKERIIRVQKSITIFKE